MDDLCIPSSVPQWKTAPLGSSNPLRFIICCLNVSSSFLHSPPFCSPRPFSSSFTMKVQNEWLKDKTMTSHPVPLLMCCQGSLIPQGTMIIRSELNRLKSADYCIRGYMITELACHDAREVRESQKKERD